MKKSFLLVLLLFTSLCFSQRITLKGNVTDDQDLPLEAATVYLTSVKDSTVIDYTITNKNGSWELKTPSIDTPVFLKISFVSFTNYAQKFESLIQDQDFGTIKLEQKSTELNEVVVEGEIPPIRIKSDTLEFNASSFKVRPDANVESLLKQLPGVEIDSEGKITVNGKEVNEILVNGKPFFDSTGKVALQNLPADLINKVQVSDTKTKEEQLSGEKAKGDNASINLTIDEDKNKGLFGKFTGGYGSSERYESSALFNYFKGDRRISILASSNNINASGFSMDEIFDNMGGGRNTSVWMSGNGSFNINGMQFGSDSGITLSNLVGVNYSDEFIKDFETDASYFYSSSSTDNDNRTRRETLLPSEDGEERRNITESVSSTKSDKYAHNASLELEFKPDSTSTIYYIPKFTRANSKYSSLSSQSTVNQDGVLLNESNGSSFSENDNSSFNSSLYYYKSFKKKGRGLSVSLENQNNIDDGANYNQSSTFFYNNENGNTEDIRNQVRYNRRTSDTYEGEISFREPITDTLKLGVGMKYRMQQSVEDREGFDYDEAAGDYIQANDSLTNYLSSKINTVIPGIGLDFYKSKYSISFEAGTAISQFDNFSNYLGDEYKLNKHYIFPELDFRFNYKFAKSKSLSLNYDYNVSFPQASQVLPVEDVSNPLYTDRGNPNLDPTQRQSIYVSFRNFDYSTRTGYNIYTGISFNNDDIIQYTEINDSGKSTTTYNNISGTYNGWLGLYYNKSFKKEEHSFRISGGMNFNFGLSKGITNDQIYKAENLSVGPRINLTYEYGELLTINPTYRFYYNQTDYTNYSINSASNFTHTVNLQTTSYWPKHVVFGNDFVYTYNSQLGDGFKKDFFLWNTSLGYNFFEDKLLLKVKVYDILNQNLGTSRSITPTSISDQQNTVLKRYVMFSLTYKLEKFAGKEKKGRSFFMY